MKNLLLKAGAAVPKLKVADPVYNAACIAEIIAAQKDCSILVFPELCLTGYTAADLFCQSPLLAAAEKSLKELADLTSEYPGLLCVCGVPVPMDGQVYNCAAFFGNGRVYGIIPKSYLPNYSEFYEERWFTPGRNLKGKTVRYAGREVPIGTDLLFESQDGAVIGAEICEDLWVPDRPSTHACLAGAEVIVNLSASDETLGKEDYRRMLVSSQSGSCYCGYVYVSSGTDESSTDMVFSGHTLIAENGVILQERNFPASGTVRTALIDLEKIRRDRRRQNTFPPENSGEEYRRVPVQMQPAGGKEEITAKELAALLRAEGCEVPPNPFVPADDAERGRRSRKIMRIQANGLATRVRSTGIKTLVIGVSGGLDSTLALLVCHEARKIVPDIRIIAYTLPNEGNTSGRTYSNAVALMKALKVESREVAIGPAVRQHLNDIGHGTEYRGEGDTTYENAQARMRTYILMDAANMENGLVVGTGDLSELALGWCTYNGDHMSMYGVNASVPKTLVQYICRSYADTCGDPELARVLYDIIDTPITPELTPSSNGQIAQKTEEKIGKYDLNDFFLYYVLRWGMEPEKILGLALAAYPQLGRKEIRSALRRFYSRFFHQQFKRSCLPDGPKVGSVTLSPRGDWRMPSDASAALWLDETDKS
ncbi:MAG: NAD(+) synthase [Lachnospiraceae bacterium]|jgi:NAD+ synthase (glutamine-hydrolysing)